MGTILAAPLSSLKPLVAFFCSNLASLSDPVSSSFNEIGFFHFFV